MKLSRDSLLTKNISTPSYLLLLCAAGWSESRGSLSGQRAGGGSDSRGSDRLISSGRESARPGGRHREQGAPGHRVRLGVQRNGSWRLKDSRVTSVRQRKLQDNADV